MPALFVFLFKVNIALLLFCAGYYLVLRHLTFYTLNRIYLVAAILFATIYPQINLSGFLQHHQQIAGTVQSVTLNLKTPAQNFVGIISHRSSYWNWIEQFFWSGVALFTFRLLMQLLSMYKIHNTSKSGILHGHSVRVINADIGPFTFWQNIYINPTNLDPDDAKNILQHEQIHVKEWHSLDILLSEISIIFYWFNPGVWLIKRAIRENIEFITDNKVLKKGVDYKKYQFSLLNVSFSVGRPSIITNHFNISTLKRRILMMNKKRSTILQTTKYIIILPILLILTAAFSTPQNNTSYRSKISTFINRLPIIRVEKEPIISPTTNKTRGSTQGNKDRITTKKESITNNRAATPSLDTILKTKPVITTHAQDSVVINKLTGITQLYGKAELNYKSMNIKADYIEYNEQTKKGTATGSVVFTKKLISGNLVSSASEFIFSLDKQY
jgi:bla regulator protein BlaR1